MGGALSGAHPQLHQLRDELTGVHHHARAGLSHHLNLQHQPHPREHGPHTRQPATGGIHRAAAAKRGIHARQEEEEG